MNFSFGWIAIAAAIAAFASSGLIMASEIAFSQASFSLPLFAFLYSAMAIVAWPFCCFALAYAHWLAQRPRFEWLWSPGRAVAAGAISGLVLGLPLTLAMQAQWWLGGIFGAMSALVLTLMARRQSVRS